MKKLTNQQIHIVCDCGKTICIAYCEKGMWKNNITFDYREDDNSENGLDDFFITHSDCNKEDNTFAVRFAFND